MPDGGPVKHSCLEYDNLPKALLSNTEYTCGALGGTVQPEGDGCPKSGVAGYCTDTGDAGPWTLRTYYYDDDPSGATYAQEACVSEASSGPPVDGASRTALINRPTEGFAWPPARDRP